MGGQKCILICILAYSAMVVNLCSPAVASSNSDNNYGGSFDDDDGGGGRSTISSSSNDDKFLKFIAERNSKFKHVEVQKGGGLVEDA